MTTLAPVEEAGQPAVRVARRGKRVLVWIRGVGHRRPDRWHLRRDIPARARRLTQVVAACGAWFNLSDVTDLAYSGWMPAETNRCPSCDLARRTDSRLT
jgi:hypothetical protein